MQAASDQAHTWCSGQQHLHHSLGGQRVNRVHPGERVWPATGRCSQAGRQEALLIGKCLARREAMTACDRGCDSGRMC